jgi:hypothetical protein
MSTTNSPAPEQLHSEFKSLRKPGASGDFFVFLVEHRCVLLIASEQRRIGDNFSSHIQL